MARPSGSEKLLSQVNHSSHLRNCPEVADVRLTISTHHKNRQVNATPRNPPHRHCPNCCLSSCCALFEEGRPSKTSGRSSWGPTSCSRSSAPWRRTLRSRGAADGDPRGEPDAAAGCLLGPGLLIQRDDRYTRRYRDRQSLS